LISSNLNSPEKSAMNIIEVDPSTSPPPAGTRLAARFSTAQLDAMINEGVFSTETDRQIHLLNGEIVIMTPPNPRHDDVLRLLSAWAFGELPKVGGAFEVCIQLSMNLEKQNSVVLPDLMLVTPQSYSSRRPNASDTRMLVEVSDTTSSFDLDEKMHMYAEAGVAEYWVIDIPHRSLIVHLNPSAGRYRSVQTFDEYEPVQSYFSPDVVLSISQLFR